MTDPCQTGIQLQNTWYEAVHEDAKNKNAAYEEYTRHLARCPWCRQHVQDLIKISNGIASQCEEEKTWQK